MSPRILLIAALALASSFAAAQDPDYTADPQSEWKESDALEILPTEAYDAAMPAGGLSNIVIFCGAGHGLTADPGDTQPEDGDRGWYTQRPITNDMVEDFGNLDQFNFFVPYAFNAGATVVPMRPVGFQPNEVVIDNADAASVEFTGDWKDSASTVYFGAAATTPYRYAVATADASAKALYKPVFPEAGFYPVYAWARPGADRVPQTYTVYYSGGSATRVVNHRRVGRGWVLLGQYYFEKGASGGVEITSQVPAAIAGHGVVVADAIRFGNGIGDVNRGYGVSGYPREEEAARYWVERQLGQGADSKIFDIPDMGDQNDNVASPSRLAALMNRETEGGYFDRLYVTFHTNAGGTKRGVLGLFNEGHPTQRQREYATILHDEINHDFEALDEGVAFDGNWDDQNGAIYGGTDYGEIRNKSVNGEFTATIIEVAYHDKPEDAALMKNPAVRDISARATYQGIVRFLNQTNAAKTPLVLLPDPPVNVSLGGDGTLSWQPAPLDGIGGDAPEGFTIWRSPNGYGFTEDSHTSDPAATSARIAPAPGQLVFYRVTARNKGGESLPSLPVAVRAGDGAPKLLLINGVKRYDTALLPTVTLESNAGSTKGGGGTVSVLRTAITNPADQLIETAKDLSTLGASFASADRGAVLAGAVKLSDFKNVVWLNGNEATGIKVFASEKEALRGYLAGGGDLLVLGGSVRWNVVEGGADSECTVRYNLKVQEKKNNDQEAILQAGPSTIFDGLPAFEVAADGRDVYSSAAESKTFPEKALALRNLSSFTDGLSGYAGVEAYSPNWRLVNFAYPLNEVTTPEARQEILKRSLAFLNKQE